MGESSRRVSVEEAGKEVRMVAGMETVADRSSTRIATSRRRFRLLDAMILVAATAVGFGGMQWISGASRGDVSLSALYEESSEFFFRTPVVVKTASDWADFLLRSSIVLAIYILPLVAMWTLALIPIRLLAPRPRLRRLARQPGMMATCAAALAMVMIGLLSVVAALVRGGNVVWELAPALWVFPLSLGLAVSVSWMTLVVGRRWRAEPSWVDRFGRGVGVFWLLAGFGVTVLFVLDSALSVCSPARHVPSP